MHDQNDSPKKTVRTYRKPEVIDRGTVESRTLDGGKSDEYEPWAHNIIWGNDVQEPTPDQW